MRVLRSTIILALAVILLPGIPSVSCPPTGSHIGVVLREHIVAEEAVGRLRDIGVDAWESTIVHRTVDGGEVSFKTVVFRLGIWLPAGPMSPMPIEATARIYPGINYSALKTNTTLEGSAKPLECAITLLLKAGVIHLPPDPSNYMVTEGNFMPADAVIEWARMEHGVELEQMGFRCGPSHANIMVNGFEADDEIGVVANSIDRELSLPVLDGFLHERGLTYRLYTMENYTEGLSSRVLIVLGGPLAYEDVGVLSRFLLPPSISEALEADSSYRVYYNAPALFKAQAIFVIAGHDRYATKAAVEEAVSTGFLSMLIDSAFGGGMLWSYQYSCSCMFKPPGVKVEGSNGSLYISYTVETPTPCYTPMVSLSLEGRRLLVEIELHRLNVGCIQCIGYAVTTIEVLNLEPGNYEVIINGESYNVEVG